MKNFMGRTMAKMNDNRKKGRKALKGFTLVEIIVVLVILAILAAAMIPALTGYIDKAKEKTAITEARNVLTAAQTIASEEYALHGTTSLNNAWVVGKLSDILALADVPSGSAAISDVTLDKAKITGLKYTTSDGSYDVTYSSTGFSVTTHTS
ncbi:MAG: type II secretion system protein [Oscillospiraceae bacterium]|nr:type II secretion system protein [Oscillospiraceae bacterium]